MPRDRSWDHLYDRERQPLRAFLLERFAAELAEDLRARPPPYADWVPGELLARHAAGRETTLEGAGLELALRAARLELTREEEALDALMRNEAPRLWPTAAEQAAGHLVVRLVTERCLELKERATGARLTRPELADAVERCGKALARG